MRLALPRRSILACAAVLSTLALLAACDGGGPVVFTHGVASGDVRPDGAVLWTRIDKDATLTVQVAPDEAFADVVLEEKVEAEEDADFTAKADVSGLEPGTDYFYRFRRDDDVSEVGAFRTAPAEDEAAPVRFIFSGDADGTVREDVTRAFDFRVLNTARAEDADFFVFFGDTIYADSPYGPKAETLDEYRAKYKENREVDPLRHILAAISIYTTWDDHEVENNFEGTTVDPDLLAAGRQAFREYMPISGDDTPEVLYRRFRWGQAVELIILDERGFRDDDVEDVCTPEGEEEADLLPRLGAPDAPEAFRDLRNIIDLPPETDPECVAALNDPERTMLGEEQKQFLLQALEESDATFKFIINEVPITEIGALPYDRWEGYRAERDEILSFIQDQGIDNVVFLTTDFHSNIISDVRLDVINEPEDGPDAPPPVAVEAVAGPIAHETLGDSIAETRGEEAIEQFELLLELVPRAECAELDAFAYGLVEVDPEAGTATIALKDEDRAELCRKVIRAQQ